MTTTETDHSAFLGGRAPVAARQRSVRADEYDALMELFLGNHDTQGYNDEQPQLKLSGSETPVPQMPHVQAGISTQDIPSVVEQPITERQPGTAAEFELLVMGHLPVRQSPWAGQYARDVAAQVGHGTMLMQMRSGTLSIDAYGFDASWQPAQPQTPAKAVDLALNTANRIVLRVDDAAEFAALNAKHASPRIVTILTAANEAAVVDAYRVLKSLVTSRTDSAAQSGPQGQPAYHVVVVDATPERRDEIALRLTDAARTFLDVAVEVSACSSHISGASTYRHVFTGESDLAVHDFFAAAAVYAEQQPVQHMPVQVTVAPDPAPVPAKESAGEIEPKPTDNMHSAPIPEVPIPAAPAPNQHPRVEPKPKSAASAQDDELDLATHVAGLTTLPVSCPAVRKAQVAVDASGDLHVLLHATDDVLPAVRQLRKARKWAQENLQLIRQAFAQRGRVAERADVVPHLFTPDAKAAAFLAGTDIKLHVLGCVQTPAGSAWFCTPVN